MKISRIEIENFRQFKDLKLNLTYPEGHKKAGQPLDKICIIGQSGTGKTTLLELIASIDFGVFLSEPTTRAHISNRYFEKEELKPVRIDLRFDDIEFSLSASKELNIKGSRDFLDDNIKNFKKEINRIWYNDRDTSNNYPIPRNHRIFYFITRQKELENLYSDYEKLYTSYTIDEDVNTANLYNLSTRNNFQYYETFQKVNLPLIDHAWSCFREILIRDITYQELRENSPSYNNQETKKTNILSTSFERLSKILNRMELEVVSDLKKTLKSQELIIRRINGEEIAFPRLSSGIKRIIKNATFLQGVYIQDSIVLMDEPENSFFPDLQSELVDFYMEPASKAQFFFATHSPIIASDFDPWEVIDLEFDSDGYVIRNEHLKDKEKGWHIDNFDYNPKWLTYQGIYRRFFDLDAVSHPDRADKLTEAALLKAESEKLQKEGKIEEARKKFDAYVTLSQQLR
ncbi:MAG: AAA family ATPase [Bacteroidota bacterium]